MNNTGVYRIVNLESGKIYVGSAKNFSQRWGMHLHQLRKGSHHSILLQRAYEKYGEDAFRFEKILICSKEDLIFYEQRAFSVLQPYDPAIGYNLCKIAGNTLGRKMSPEAIEKMRKSVTGIKRRTGYKHTDEARANMSKCRLGNKNAVGNTNWLGRKHSEETKANMAEKAKGRKHSEETKSKISELSRRPEANAWKKGRKASAQARENMRLAHLGKPTAKRGTKQKPHSEETKRKISEGHKRFHARRREELL